MVSAAILAGGRARRFGGQDKSRLVVDGRPIIARQLDVLHRVAAEVFAVAPDPARFASVPLAVHADRIPNLGVIGGIYTALACAAGECVVVVACDLPFLSAPLLQRLIDLSTSDDGAWVVSARGVEPLLACYRRHAAARVREAIDAGDLKAADLGRRLRMAPLAGEALAEFGDPERLLANVNTPGDFARVQYRPS
jgi:molybdopterin-guanine dinucleotide biosynthesis protein A